jgi:small-conductance mechanosensitive channel
MILADAMQPVADFVDALVEFIPVVLIALSLLAIGVVFSILLGRLVRFVIRKIRLEAGLKQIGAEELLERVGYDKPISVLLAGLVRWTGFLLTFILVSNALGFEELSEGLTQIIAYLPRLIVAFLFIAMGVWGAGLIYRLIVGLSEEEGENSPFDATRLIAQIVYYGLIVITIAVAADQLGLPTRLINGIIFIAGGAVALAGAISVGIGSRETARNFIARSHAMKQYQVGDYVTVQDKFSGIVRGTTATHLIVRTSDGEITIPYHLLMNEVVWLDTTTPRKHDLPKTPETPNQE